MSAPARLLLRLLAPLLLLQWLGGVPAHARAMAALGASPGLSVGASPGEAVVICTADGLRTIHLGGDGRPAPDDGAAPGCCLLCPGPAAGGVHAAGPTLPPPAELAAPDLVMAVAARALALRPPPRIHHSRAPPVS